MPTIQKSNVGTSLGISGLVFGIAALFTLFLFNGMLSVLLGVVGIIAASVGIGQARDNNGETGMIYTGLTVSIIGTTLALLWFFMVPGIVNPIKQRIEQAEQVEHIHKHIKKTIHDGKITEEELEEVAEDIEEVVDGLNDEFENILIDLESDLEEGKHRIEIHINDSEIHKIKRATGNVIREAIDEILEELPDSIEITIETDKE